MVKYTSVPDKHLGFLKSLYNKVWIVRGAYWTANPVDFGPSKTCLYLNDKVIFLGLEYSLPRMSIFAKMLLVNGAIEHLYLHPSYFHEEDEIGYLYKSKNDRTRDEVMNNWKAYHVEQLST